jgi:5'(3')-deoxyribonucleotidase
VSDPQFDDRQSGLRVGVDMDGVLADFNTSWMRRYNTEFGAQLDASLVQRWDGLHKLTHFGSMAEFWAWARGDDDSIFRHAPPLPGAVEGVRRISRKHRLVIVSSKFDWAIPDSLAWLSDQRIPAREVHFLWRKSSAHCDVYLEDAPYQLEELRRSLPEATVCRRVQAWNDPLPGVTDIDDWATFEALVDELAEQRAAAARRI